MKQHLQSKKGVVDKVFNKVFDKYDLMNDFMSFGIHKIWKKNLVLCMNPSKNKSLIDVACGTGDIANLYTKYTNQNSEILCVDPNVKMITKGKKKLIRGKMTRKPNFKKAIVTLKKGQSIDLSTGI